MAAASNSIMDLLLRVAGVQVPQGARTPGFNPEAPMPGQGAPTAPMVAAPQINVEPEAPTMAVGNNMALGTMPGPPDPLEVEIAALDKQRNAIVQQVMQESSPNFLRKQFEQEVGDFSQFANREYERKYGGSGFKNTAGRFLLDFLEGMKHGQTLREATEAKAAEDWKRAQTNFVQRQNARRDAMKVQHETLQSKIQELRLRQQQQRYEDLNAQALARIQLQTGQLDLNKQREDRLATTARRVTGTVAGQQLLDAGITQVQGVPTDPQGEYGALLNYEGVIVGGVPLKPEFASRVFDDWAQDSAGNWGKIVFTGDGKVRSFVNLPPPPEFAGRITSHTTFRSVTDASGKIYLVPVTEETRTGPAGSAGVSIPSVSAGAPMSVTAPAGATPTMTVVQGAPTSPVNQGAPARAGRVGTPVAVGERPINIPATTSAQLAGFTTSLNMMKDANTKLNDTEFMKKVSVGPIAGRITLAEWERLGGAGATPEENELATLLRRAIATEAFANGGKQLTEREYTEFAKTLPQMTDTLAKAAQQARLAIKFLEDKRRETVRSLNPQQRAYYEKEYGISALGAAPSGVPEGFKVIGIRER